MGDQVGVICGTSKVSFVIHMGKSHLYHRKVLTHAENKGMSNTCIQTDRQDMSLYSHYILTQYNKKHKFQNNVCLVKELSTQLGSTVMKSFNTIIDACVSLHVVKCTWFEQALHYKM